MKNLFARLTVVSVAALGVAVCAQTPDQPAAAPPPAQAAQPDHAMNPQKQLNHLTKKLALTGDQQNQLLPVLTDRQQQVEAINSDNTLTPKQRHARLKSVRSDSEAKIRNVLTDTQRAAYDQMQQEARERAQTRKQTQTAVQ